MNSFVDSLARAILICVLCGLKSYAQANDFSDLSESSLTESASKDHDNQCSPQSAFLDDSMSSPDKALAGKAPALLSRKKRSRSTDLQCIPEISCPPTLFFEAKAAYFHPIKSKIQDIYSDNMGMYGVEMTWRERDQYIGLWVSASYLGQSGHSIGGHHRTEFTLVPLGMGFEYIHNFESVDLYLGMGGLYSYLLMHDHSPFVIHTSNTWDWGGIWKMGIRIFPTNYLFIDVFSDFSYMKFHFHNVRKVVRHDPNFSGFSVGVAIGVAI